MIAAQIENLTEVLEELKPLFPKHWEELALNKDSIPLDPQYDIYIERDSRGEVIFSTVRDSGELIGYFVGFINPGLHYRTCLTCIMDIFYVVQDKRGRRAGVKLFKSVEKELTRRGVNRWYVGEKLHKPCGALFKYLGFEPVEKTYSKMIGEA